MCVIRCTVLSLMCYHIVKECTVICSAPDSTTPFMNTLVEHPRPQASAYQNHQRLDAMLKYNFMTPETQLRQGLTYLGSNWRLRRAVHKLMTEMNPELWIGAIGGSITAGSYVDKKDIWFSVLQSWLVSLIMHYSSKLKCSAKKLQIKPNELHSMCF